MLLLIGKKVSVDVWMVAPFGGASHDFEGCVKHIREVNMKWAYNEMSGDLIRKGFEKVYEEEL